MRKNSGFVLLPVIVVIVILLVLAAIFFAKPDKKSFLPSGNKIFPQTAGDLINTYPHECKSNKGFDNWRTDKTFAVDPRDSNILYVAIEYKGVYKSTDAGKTWNLKVKGLRGYPKASNPKEPCFDQHPFLVIDPTNHNRILLTSASSPGILKDMNSENGGLYESLDGAENWHQLFKDNMEAWTYEALAIDPANPKTVYVGVTSMPASYNEANPNKIFVTKGIMYKTTDSGKTWSELSTGFVPNLRAGKLFIDSKNTSHIVFTTFASPPNRGGGQVLVQQMGILESVDAGKTWKKLESLPGNERAVREADIAPANFNNIFITVAKSNEEELKFYSVDGGKTFNPASTQVNLFKFDPHDPSGQRLLGFSIYAAPRTIFESLDSGKSWHDYSSLPKEASNESRVSNIVWDPANKNIVYLNGDQGIVWKSEDGGKSWQLILSLEKLK